MGVIDIVSELGGQFGHIMVSTRNGMAFSKNVTVTKCNILRIPRLCAT